MPHQCLQCGRAFEQGDAKLLKGCPDCGGTRFFFSANPVDAAERERIRSEQSSDVKSVIAQLLAENPNASPADLLKQKTWDEWVQLPTPKTGAPEEDAVETAQRNLAEDTDAPTDNAGADADLAARMTAAVEDAKTSRGKKARETPGTVQVQGPGCYELDVEALMAHDPIVIEKDGTYMIHLPSVIEGGRKGRRDR